MTVFMTGSQKPFFAGTYFPPEARNGMIGMKELLLKAAESWRENKDALLESADHITELMKKEARPLHDNISEALPELAYEMLTDSFDESYGGFGAAPKFPTPHNLIFLSLYGRIKGEAGAFEQVKKTLEAMRRGGIFDQIGYGFSRYSTDRYYLVPHFEKMLYDNALLIIAYCAAYKLSGEEYMLDTAEKTADYICRAVSYTHLDVYKRQGCLLRRPGRLSGSV